MSDYYFDIETYSKTKDPDFNNDEIIAITYQQIDSRTGDVKGKLNILKSWESSEKEILQRFYPIFNVENKWDFVPIGYNLSFDFTSLIYRWRKMDIKVNGKSLLSLFAQRAYIDIEPVVIIFNHGRFEGAKLEKFAGKRYSGSKIREWYEKKDYPAIQDYIEDEIDRFLKLYQFSVQRLPDVWLEFAKESKIVV
jgi:DNA polymerase elongation subunit (family B)